jgi:hypothetical protein
VRAKDDSQEEEQTENLARFFFFISGCFLDHVTPHNHETRTPRTARSPLSTSKINLKKFLSSRNEGMMYGPCAATLSLVDQKVVLPTYMDDSMSFKLTTE